MQIAVRKKGCCTICNGSFCTLEESVVDLTEKKTKG